MKKLFTFVLFLLVLILVLQLHLVSFACEPTPTPPPPPPADCSAGFWKNHTELWDGGPFITDWTFDDMLAALKSNGNDPDRAFVVGWLNAEYPEASCDED